MGLGDELMAAGAAELTGRKHSARVKILDRHGRGRWHELWFGAQHILGPDQNEPGMITMVDGPGVRPYIEAITPERFVWLPYHPIRYQLPLVRVDMAGNVLKKNGVELPARYVLVEPNIKPRASPNKQWPADRWFEFSRLCRDAGIQLVQAIPRVDSKRYPRLAGVQAVLTLTVWEALSVLDGAIAYVGHEGFFHHASAALLKRAVVIYGGFISPDITGYVDQRNLFTGGSPCGSRKPCEHCRLAMEAITPADVFAQLEEII